MKPTSRMASRLVHEEVGRSISGHHRSHQRSGSNIPRTPDRANTCKYMLADHLDQMISICAVQHLSSARPRADVLITMYPAQGGAWSHYSMPSSIFGGIPPPKPWEGSASIRAILVLCDSTFRSWGERVSCCGGCGCCCSFAVVVFTGALEWRGDADLSLYWDEVLGVTLPFYGNVCQRIVLDLYWLLTSFAHLSPQLLHKSRFPLGPRLHSGVTRVWQFTQSFCIFPAPLRLFRFFLLESRLWSSSARSLLRFSICRSSNCQLVLRVVFSSSKTFSSEARASC